MRDFRDCTALLVMTDVGSAKTPPVLRPTFRLIFFQVKNHSVRVPMKNLAYTQELTTSASTVALTNDVVSTVSSLRCGRGHPARPPRLRVMSAAAAAAAVMHR